MNSRTRLLVLLAALVVVVGGAWLAYTLMSGTISAEAEPTPAVEADAGEPDGAEATAERYTDFTGQDGAGNPVSLSDFDGKPTVVLFWATWCDYCKQEMTELQRLYDQVDPADYNFVAVNMTSMDDNREDAVSDLDEMGYGFAAMYDVDGEAMNAYGVTAIPVTLFIGSDGELVHSQLGAMDLTGLETYFNQLT